MMAVAPRGREPRRPAAVIGPIAVDLLSRPLDFLQAEHYRQRCVLNHLEHLAVAPPAPVCKRMARAVLDYLRRDLLFHIADEELDLFPAMRRRCLPTDNCDAMFNVLSEEHEDDEGDAG